MWITRLEKNVLWRLNVLSNNFANKIMYDEFVFVKSQLLFFLKKGYLLLKIA